MQAQFHLQPQHNQHISSEHAANFQQQPPPTMQTLRLRDNVVTPASTSPRASRKRKSPDTPPTEQQPPPLPPHLHNMPPNPYAAGPVDFTPGGMPPHPGPPGPSGDADSQHDSDGQSKNRPLSQSKRAEQNRKAQRAFRERRDAHVKSLESRSQLLDSALASADEANRKWQECRDLVDQLRIENQQLRAAFASIQSMHPGIVAPPPVHLPPHLLTTSPRVPTTDGNANDTSQEEKEKRP